MQDASQCQLCGEICCEHAPAVRKVPLVIAALDELLGRQTFLNLQVNNNKAMRAHRCGVISALSKQRRRGVPAAARAHELWRELQASGLADRDAAATTIGARADC